MKFTVTKASDIFATPVEVEINSLEQLKAISDRNKGHSLIVNFDTDSITVYDDYVE